MISSFVHKDFLNCVCVKTQCGGQKKTYLISTVLGSKSTAVKPSSIERPSSIVAKIDVPVTIHILVGGTNRAFCTKQKISQFFNPKKTHEVCADFLQHVLKVAALAWCALVKDVVARLNTELLDHLQNRLAHLFFHPSR